MINEKATAVVDVNGKNASEMLGKLEKEAKKLRDRLKEATKAGDLNAWKGANNALKKVNKDITTLKKSTFDTAKVLKNLNGTNLNDLNRAKKALVKEMGKLNQGTREYTNKAKDIKKVTAQISKVKGEMFGTTKQTSAWGKALGGIKTMLPALGIGALVTGLFKAGKALFELSAQMEQSARKARLVLGPAYAEITRLAKEHAKAVGLTNREYRDAVTNVADLLVPLDFTRRQAAVMASDVINLAGAFSEWSGGMYDAREVSQDLNKGILGEMETLKKYGIAIRKDSEEWKELVKQKYEDGAATQAQAEALTAYELILKKSADAQASFNEEVGLLVRTKKDSLTWWRGIKEGAVEFFDLMGKQASYLGDNWDLMWNRMKDTVNDFVNQFGMKDVFDIEPLTAFSNAILESDRRFVPFIKKIEEIGLQTKEGKQTFVAMADALGKVYGKEGVQVATQYYKTQKMLIEQQEAAWKAEEEATLENNRKKLEKREQQEIAALEETHKKLLEIQKKFEETKFNTRKQLGLLNQEELEKAEIKNLKALFDKEIITLEEFDKLKIEIKEKFTDAELAELEKFENAKAALRKQLGLATLEEEKRKEIEIVRDGYAEGLLTYEEYKIALNDIDNKYRDLKIEQRLLDEEELTERREIELEDLEKRYEAGIISETDYQAAKNEIVKFYADEEIKTQQEKFKKLAELVAKWGGAVNSILSALGNKYEAQKQKEIAIAEATAKRQGKSEEWLAKEKEKIQKDYAKKQQKIALIQAIINTAIAVTSALTTQPFMPLGLIMAVLAGIAGAIEISTISSQQFAKGKYPVRGIDDGKLYRANVSRGTTGVYSEPTITPGFGLYAESGPELVVDSPTFRNIQMNTPGLIESIMAHRVPQFATGDYSSADSSGGVDMSQIEEVLERTIASNAMLTEAIMNPPPPVVPIGDRQIRDIRTEIQKTDAIEEAATRG